MGSPERQSGVSNVDESSSVKGNEPVEKDESSSSTSSAPNEEHPQLSLIPLHPASKKLHAKQLPIVLGRTDLAAWWWKACPCQHYCRLHCRPVAQNIRSLSKVMIQIDTAARVHIVGKNPHLITITPDRDDNILRENDVISIGRRDREPWMRFQVIRKPEGHDGAAPLVVGRQRAATATAAVYSSNQRGAKTAAQKSNNAPNATPPEWITTDSRKRKPSRSSSKSLSSLSNMGAKQQPKQRPPRQQGADNPQQPTAQEAASAATIARVQRSYVKANHQAAAASNKEAAIGAGGLSPPRKRRRRGTNADTNTGNENSPRRARRSGSRHNHKSNDAVATDGLERTSGGNPTGMNSNNNVSSSKRDRPHVHLVFQDYQTSAYLLEGNEIRRKSESSINQATTRASSATSVVRYHQHGRSTPPRAFLADKSQLRLLSKNFAEALLGAVSPTANEQTVATPVGVGEEIAGSFRNIGTTVKKTSDKPTVAYAAEKPPRSKLLLPSSEEMDNLPQSSESKKFFKAIVGQARDGNSGQILKGDDEDECVSVLSVPECASSSFEPGQEDLGHSGDDNEVVEESHQTGLIQAPVEKTVQTRSKMPRDGSDSSSSSSPAMWDPLSDLQPWQNMMKREEERGNSSSFRHALASLIVAKNQDRVNTAHDKRRRLMWIPSLLGEDFKIEEPEA